MPGDNLRSALDAIPVAHNGAPIGSEFHNTMRAAILLLGGQTDSGSGTRATTLTFAPTFFPISDGGVTVPEWTMALGTALKPANANSASGWFPVQLPDGARIRQLKVHGRKVGGAPLGFSVRLMRQSLATADSTTLITLALKSITGEPFNAPPGEIPGDSPAVLQELQTVDSQRYQYLVQAVLTNAVADTEIQIYSVQITYSMS